MNKRLLVFLFLILSYTGYSQTCKVIVTITPDNPNICSGTPTILTAKPTGGSGTYTYAWSNGDTNASTSVNKAGTYTVIVTDKAGTCGPGKASKTVTATTTPDPPTIDNNQVVCYNTKATLTPTGPGGVYQWYDASGNFLKTTNSYITDNITGPTTFQVRTTINGCTSQPAFVTVNVTGKPNTVGDTVCYGTSATLTASGGDSYTWYNDLNNATAGTNSIFSGSTFLTPALLGSRLFYVVAIINGCPSPPTAVAAKVTPPPQKPTVTPPAAICTGSTANLHADAPAGSIIDWFDVPNGGTSLISSPDFTTPVLTATTTYYVQTTVNDCQSERTPVTVTVGNGSQPPQPPPASTCYGTSANLVADAPLTGSYAWYTQPTGGAPVHTGNNYVTPVLTYTTTYYVQHINGPCTSDRVPVIVTVTTPPAAPSASGPVVCYGSSASITATSPAAGATFQWFTVKTGGAPISNTATLNTPALTADKTYYVQTTVGGCISDRTEVNVTVQQPIPAPTVTQPATACSGSTVTLTATGSPDDYAWYATATGGTPLITGPAYVTPALTATKTYYVESTANDCSSARTAVTVNVTQSPAPPTVSGNTTVCPGSSANLTASVPGGGTAAWYTSASATTPVHTGNSYTTPPLSAATTYYVQTVNGSCSSTRTTVTVPVTNVADPQFKYPSGTFCTSGSNPTPTVYNPAGGTFSASAGGLVFVNTHTGQINVAASTIGKYIISFASNGTCPGITTAEIAIVSIPDAHFSYSDPSYCQDGPNPLPTFTPGTSGGIFSSTSTGVVFVNTSTGEINLKASKAGTFVIVNTITANGGCPGDVQRSLITIDPNVKVTTGSDQIIQQGGTAQLEGSITGGVTTGKWTGGTGTFSDNTNPKAIYTPGPGETKATLTLTSDDPPGTCGPHSAQVNLEFNPVPDAPTIVGNTAVCLGSTTTLTATAPGGTYRWYLVPTGGSITFTGPIFKTPPVTAQITYYVQTTREGIISPRTPVTVNVNPPPAAPVVATPAPICEGSTVMLTATGSTPGSYIWYDQPVGGTKLSIQDTYTTPSLITGRSFYVQTTVGTCVSNRTQVDVTVTPAPHVSSGLSDIVCSGTALNYTITADQPAATFTYSRAAKTGISNAPATGVASSTITETLINTTTAPVDVKYIITPQANGCPGPDFTYTVTVNPTPKVISTDSVTACNGEQVGYAVKFNINSTSFTWSRGAVPGIKNAAVSGQAAATIKETLFNNTTAPVNVTYTFNYKTSTCQGSAFNLTVAVNPQILITSENADPACSGTPQNYTITSNIPSATFSWSRAAVTGISNPAVNNKTSNVIDENLTNTGLTSVKVVYIITPTAYGCSGTPFTYTVTVGPQPAKPDVAGTVSNSPVCAGTTIELNTPTVAKASYLWTGPNGYTSQSQNPKIVNATAANAGTYHAYVIVNGCTSVASNPVNVEVDEQPIANAGADLPECQTVQSVTLDGSVSVTGTGIWSTVTTDGGTFVKNDDLKTSYTPSAADRTAGFALLVLSSTSKACFVPTTDTVKIIFTRTPATNAGADQGVCAQDVRVQLDGRLFISGGVKWTKGPGATGSFSPSDAELKPFYVPTAADVARGSVKLYLTALAAGECDFPTDSVTIKFIPPPVLTMDPVRYVLKDRTITLNPTVSNENVQYLWTPTTGINDNTIKNPIVTGDQDITYHLTITDIRGCTDTASTRVIVSPALTVPNTFTPNGDATNDYWDIKGLIAYQDATVDVFNRYGQPLFHSIGYDKPWNGTYNGNAVPPGTYYYVIKTNYHGIVLSGYVVILR